MTCYILVLSRIFDDIVRQQNSNFTDKQLEKRRKQEFENWLRQFVSKAFSLKVLTNFKVYVYHYFI